ncbi:MAG: 16S rRNA (cytidine(1402)-2'-O)-methyltransferase [Chloroflexi bacterium]|nr:16S rRNA (cytidine(1402)-2'-O)-methyltransferase [Chloroflexota bacterium]
MTRAVSPPVILSADHARLTIVLGSRFYNQPVGILYLVATPIGNLEDVTLRALRILREVSLVAAEDTRTARKLLSHYGIKARLTSYTDHNKRTRIPAVLAALGRGDVALVSEAGMPGVSDPGHDLVVAASEAGFPVVPVPGPSAVTAALAVSGLPTRQFTYVGFLPRRAGERRRLLQSLAAEPRTIVAFESPHRLERTLADMLSVLGDRRLAVCRELTKAFEEVFRGTVSEAIERFRQPRGEFTLVVEGLPAGRHGAATDVGATFRSPAGRGAEPDTVRRELQRLRDEGQGARQAVAEVARRYGLPHRRVYRLWLDLRQSRR